MIQIYILLGGLVGPDGYVTSAGMFSLAKMLGSVPAVAVTTLTWNNWYKVVQPPSGDKLVLIGYSGGGSRATWVPCLPSRRIDLLVAYDPSPKWQMKPLGSNVKKAICYFNSRPMMPSPYGMLGGGMLTATPEDGCPNIIVSNIAEQHLLVQFDQNLHARTVLAVRELLSSK